jgi:hypothetical protein
MSELKMSDASIKTIRINVKDLSFKRDQNIADLVRFLAEALPQTEITRNGNILDVVSPVTLSKRAIRLRIKKFLHKRKLSEEFRPISFKNADENGYIIKEKKKIQFSYY